MDVPTGRTIVVNEKWRQQVGEDGMRAYVDAVLSVAADNLGPDVDVVTDELTSRLRRAGIEMAPVEAKQIAEHLAGDGPAEVTITTDSGEVIARSGGNAHVPQGNRALDPEEPERPAGM